MPTDPANNRYSVPFEYGEDGYDTPINHNFDDLATEVPVSGPLADRRNPGQEFAPDFYYATDKRICYRNTGASWEAITPRYRLLSTFPTVQAAADYSDANATAIFVDGVYETDEGTVELPQHHCFVGMGWNTSKIVFTQGGTAPLFEYPAERNEVQWANFRIELSGTPKERPGFKPGTHGVNNHHFAETYWQNIQFRDVGGTYPVEIQSAYGAQFDNIVCHTRFGTTTGHYRFDNCNASNFNSVKSFWNEAEDSLTPCMYIKNCTATQFNSPHIEHLVTDAAMQITQGRVTVLNPHIEGNTGGGFPASVHCGIQIGDGGLTEGNTDGEAGVTNVNVTGGIIHGSSEPEYEGFRILDGGNTTLTNTFANANPAYNYGGSNQHTQAELTVHPRNLLIMGDREGQVMNSTSDSSPSIINMQPYVAFNENDLNNNIQTFDLMFGRLGANAFSMAYKRQEGTVCVWDSNRTI